MVLFSLIFVAAFLAIISGSEKIRRIVEVLRADVIQGLGVQLLEQVYDILEEEDELEREVSVFSRVNCLCYRLLSIHNIHN